MAPFARRHLREIAPDKNGALIYMAVRARDLLMREHKYHKIGDLLDRLYRRYEEDKTLPSLSHCDDATLLDILDKEVRAANKQREQREY